MSIEPPPRLPPHLHTPWPPRYTQGQPAVAGSGSGSPEPGQLQVEVSAAAAAAAAAGSARRALFRERWHWGMVMDRRRNQAYDRAIAAAVQHCIRQHGQGGWVGVAHRRHCGSGWCVLVCGSCSFSGRLVNPACTMKKTRLNAVSACSQTPTGQLEWSFPFPTSKKANHQWDPSGVHLTYPTSFKALPEMAYGRTLYNLQ